VDFWLLGVVLGVVIAIQPLTLKLFCEGIITINVGKLLH
jgi:hypothetical protein